jgi:hypothetical protein
MLITSSRPSASERRSVNRYGRCKQHMLLLLLQVCPHAILSLKFIMTLAVVFFFFFMDSVHYTMLPVITFTVVSALLSCLNPVVQKML